MADGGTIAGSQLRSSGGSIMDPQFLLNLPPRIVTHSYTKRDTMLYALGVGAGHDQMGEADLPFVFEEDLRALPSMAVILAYPGFWQMEPHYGIDWRRVLHAEQSCEFHELLPVEGKVRGELSIDAIVDKGREKGALLRARRLIYDDADNRLLATVRQVSFLRGDGGRGGGGAALVPLSAVPDREPDKVVAFEVRPEQALIYRLSGDYNPLHANPAAARDAGFDRPVLHGLCTYGFAGRAILAAVCNNDPALLKALECRFTAPVYPGQNLDVRIWLETAEDIAFQLVVSGIGKVVIDNGRARIGLDAHAKQAIFSG